MVVSVDFDGTITKSSDFNNDGFNVIRPGCKKAMQELTKIGVQFVLLTGRSPEWVGEAVRLCQEWALPIDVSTPNTKRITDIYIDDKNLGCTGIDWKVIYRQIYALAYLERRNKKI